MISLNRQRADRTLILRVIIGGIFTAAVVGFLYEQFLTWPILPTLSPKIAWALAGLGAFIVGCSSYLWTRTFFSMLLASIAGIIMGTTWPPHQHSDLLISWWAAIQDTIFDMWHT
jgi:hypothetical protein